MSRHEDHATIIDSLDRLPLVEKLADAVMTCRPPRVFGVHGDWGEGKTSFLHQLHYRLDGMPNRTPWVDDERDAVADIETLVRQVIKDWKCMTPDDAQLASDRACVVWFEAWRYQHEAAPVVALLQEIRGQLDWFQRSKNQAFKLLEVSARQGLVLLGTLAHAIGTPLALAAGAANNIQSEGEKWERAHFAERLPGEALREQLRAAIDQALGNEPKTRANKRKRLIVIIDDLDRCEPTATFRLLEGIKVYLNLPNCVFVMGMDRRVIIDAVAEAAPGNKRNRVESNRRAKEYLEKLFQSVYYLPKVQDIPKSIIAWLPPDKQKLSVKDRERLFEVLKLYKRCAPANPRKIKAFAGDLWRFLTESPRQKALFALSSHHGAAQEPVTKDRDIALAVILASLHCFHPEIYRAVEDRLGKFYRTLWAWCAGLQTDGDADFLFGPGEFECLKNLELAYQLNAPVVAIDAKIPELRPRAVDSSRGDVLRVQDIILHARPYSDDQIKALLLR